MPDLAQVDKRKQRLGTTYTRSLHVGTILNPLGLAHHGLSPSNRGKMTWGPLNCAGWDKVIAQSIGTIRRLFY